MIDLGRQLNTRIKAWREELCNHIYEPIAPLVWEGFTAFEHISAEQAQAGEFRPMGEGTEWGRKWEYGWFRTSCILPDHMDVPGQRVLLYPGLGGEMLIWVNGKARGSVDKHHEYVVLSGGEAGYPDPVESPGKKIFSVLVESYAGHGFVPENIGPCPRDRAFMQEPPVYQQKIRGGTFGLQNEIAYQLMMDMETLWSLLEALPEKSLRAQKVAKAIKDVTLIVDFEQPREKRQIGFIEAGKVLKPVLDCGNGSTAPVMTVFGQSHLDLAWKWPYEETKRKAARTYANQLALIEEYPQYQFLMCEPYLIEIVRTHYPELFNRVMDRVKGGNFIPEGAFWVECDTNIPSGESLIRQLVWGQRWFHRNCGAYSQMAWAPDTFGFTAALPQILRECNISYFATQKLFRGDPESEKFPFNNFVWEGLDGTGVHAHFFLKNNSPITPALLIQRWETDRVQQENIEGMFFPFGHGDGGGGATRDMLEVFSRLTDLEGAPRTRMESPVAFFKRFDREFQQNRWTGELYLAWHRGTYTVQARTKAGCRRAEFSLREAEFWAALAWFGNKAPYPGKRIAHAWDRLLFNQFHDVLGGVGIRRVHDEAGKEFAQIDSAGKEMADEGIQNLLKPDRNGHPGSYTAVNSFSWERDSWLELPLTEYTQDVVDTDGISLPWTRDGSSLWVRVKIPPCGWTTIRVIEGAGVTEKLPVSRGTVTWTAGTDGNYILQNELLSITVDSSGRLAGVIHRESGQEFISGIGNEFRMYQDINPVYDAWEISRIYTELPVELGSKALLSIKDMDGQIVVLHVERVLHESKMEQDIILRAGSPVIEFKTAIDWRERHKLLKVYFPSGIHTNEAFHEIQFGYISRPVHKNTKHDRDRYEVCNHRYTAMAEANRGAAILNDSKYGVSTDRTGISLTLLRSPLVPDAEADQGRQCFTYGFYPFMSSFSESNTHRLGYELNMKSLVCHGAGGKGSFFEVSADTVVIETVTVSAAEDALILRMYEAVNSRVSCTLHIPPWFSTAWQTNLLEEIIAPLSIEGHGIFLQFRPFEVKTIELVPKLG